jgi:hypothetical protein
MSPDATPTPANDESGHSHREPLLRVVSGSPTPDEVAVIVAVLSTRARPAVEHPQFSLWSRKSRQVRPNLRPGFGAWRASMMPR